MFISTIHSIENISKLKEAGIDAICIGVKGFSIRQSNLIDMSELSLWVKTCHEQGVLLYVNCLKLFMEHEMDSVKAFLCACKEQEVDGIYYSDEGIYFEAKQLGIHSKLIYQPETLVTSTADAKFYLDLGIQSVSLAHELSLDEIKEIAHNTSNIEVLVSGHFSILYSKRKLVQNYFDAIHQEYDASCRYDLIEQTRQDRLPIIEDENGTHIFSSKSLCSYQEIQTLVDVGISRFRIDSLFFDDEWTCKVISNYKKILETNEVVELDGSNHWYYQTTMTKKKGETV